MSNRNPRRVIDAVEIAVRLRSPDADVRRTAVRQACPCRSGFTVYERLRQEIGRLRKDPDPAVRQAALHVIQEACEIERKEAELDRADDLGLRLGDADWTAAQHRRRATGTWEPLQPPRDRGGSGAPFPARAPQGGPAACLPWGTA